MRKTPWNREDHILRLEELTGDRKEHWQGFQVLMMAFVVIWSAWLTVWLLWMAIKTDFGGF